MKLSNGISIPEIGFGTWQTPDGKTAADCVKYALSVGYRHIDTAACYGNEKGVGEGIKAAIDEGIVKREDVFLTSKLWNTERGYDKTLRAFEQTMSDLGTDYIDLYLIHWPASSHRFADWEEINLATWKAMTELYKSGRIRAIGVSNFEPHHLNALMQTEVKPMVNQIEYHPGCLQKEIVEYCRENGILVEAWSPLGSGRVLGDERLKKIAAKYGKSVAQICIRFALQNGILPLPKSVTESRIDENFNVWDFNISEEDINEINSMGEFGGSGLNPDEIDF